MQAMLIGPGGSAFDSTLRGLQTASGRAASDAESIATNGPDVDSMVDLDVQTDTYGALAQVIRASDQMTRSTLDLLA